MPFVLALFSAGLYGAADFFGGLAARRSPVTGVVTIAQGTGFALLLVIVPFLPSASVAPADVGWGAAAGLAGGLGVALLYRALAVSTMAIVAPVTAVCAVLIPVVAEVVSGQRLGSRVVAGIALALLAIALVGQQPDAPGAPPAPPMPADVRQDGVPSRRAGLGIALLSGVAIGFFFLCLAETRREAQMWPLVVARAASTIVFAVTALATGRSLKVPVSVLRLAIVGGALDMVANALYLLATRGGPLSTVVTLVSLYPASTVILARICLGERVSRIQGTGILCALAAVLLIVGGN